MICSEIVAELREVGALWQSGVLADSMFEASVLEVLSEVDSNEYEVTELLEPNAISLLLEHGSQQLKYQGAGGIRIVVSGRVVDISHLAVQYRKLFEQWSRRGWVNFSGNEITRQL